MNSALRVADDGVEPAVVVGGVARAGRRAIASPAAVSVSVMLRRSVAEGCRSIRPRPLQLLDERRHRRLVAGDRAAERGLRDAGIVVDHHHRGEAAGLQVELAGVAGKGAERGVLGEAQMEADEVGEEAELHVAGALRPVACGRAGETLALFGRRSTHPFLASAPVPKAVATKWFCVKPSGYRPARAVNFAAVANKSTAAFGGLFTFDRHQRGRIRGPKGAAERTMSPALESARHAVLHTLRRYLAPALCILLPLFFYLAIFQPIVVGTVLGGQSQGASPLTDISIVDRQRELPCWR